MDLVRRARAMKEAAALSRAQGRLIGFVPTMGALHEGHLTLVRQVRARADVTVVSIFVNPTQFGAGEDYGRYPRDLARDAEMLAAAGVDVLFAPDTDEIYPPGSATLVEVEGLSDTLEGASRPGHFRGVATVVAKLLGIVHPHVAAFGQKDAQQTIVVKRMVRDLMLDVEIVVVPTQRDVDGVALSSRNVYLSSEERAAARAIPHALEAARAAAAGGERRAAALLDTCREILAGEPLLKLDYLALVDTERLLPVERLEAESLLAVAVFAGKTRLIDNIVLRS